MGPFALMDFLGLDVCFQVGQYLQQQYGERMRGAALLARLVAAGRLGEKSGAGFYGYGDQTDELVGQLAAELAAGGPRSTFGVERLMYPLCNEAARCVAEGIADVKDIDGAMIAGTGLTYQGERMGPLALADLWGLDVLVSGLEELEKVYGARFHPADKLYELIQQGRLGRKTRAGLLEYV
jgi:3-hydroxyacyl-CoA dehydrogenase